ncbi:NAC domain-containing protein 105 [Physcomitrium patens]|uniref:NAC transcription factor PpVNS2 n=1 Tax=Physcomitrium patens TaxID=3218 RepID=X5IAY4_PHYPA|nr:NAC domain-containing protein 105-like [Physcomitrium patens]XP_024369494.1 NAC domain-containing protein 105-like [Physcomitrium patens]XP_024369495.1 NAC domain-containing protein 105-like [Physcomitrium patens]XP_024369496.1 NAC domain-containing protein 105-like [Physcomitrium patens]XP_024369497.1 NAC domain-containing protein 105-like [Physcomitrium patens]PNR57369.1 hypothetical protein PHYPA_004363 [Physcomitrium patens]BAO66172.1 NAC transcription factor PpVNS2 [Physcomitrium pate|eukprot:XP_024369492.1 NAC domain-containing protein 105-like [Physcomitrella patens]
MTQPTTKVPVGFRFHPTDEELVGYYLPKKVTARKIDLDLIRDLDLYKLEPWDLQELCKIQADSNEKQTDYYFFSRKDKKYPTGNRANRATTKGFWKATGRDKPIHTKLQTLIGMRKTLVFYQGRAPHGVKTDWIMHEFRLDDGPGRPAHEDGGWVVCRVFKKNKNLKLKLQEKAVSYEEQLGLPSEHMGSPDILSGGARFAYPEQTRYADQPQYGSIKQEIINLDEYQSRHSDMYVNQFSAQMEMPTKVENQSHSMPSSSISDQARSYLCRVLSFRRPDDYLNLNPYPETPANPENSTEYTEPQTSGSGSDGDTHEEESILGNLDSVDWSALLQEPTSGKDLRCPTPVSTKANADDMTALIQLRRQNSDIFSSLDLWNYAHVAQQTL